MPLLLQRSVSVSHRRKDRVLAVELGENPFVRSIFDRDREKMVA